MKHLNIIAAAAMLTAAGAGAELIEFTAYRVSPATPLAVPAVSPDTVFGKANKFDAAKLLNARRIAVFPETEKWELANSDTAKTVRFTRPAQRGELRSMYVRMRPERFVKGTLKLNTNARAEVFVDGKSVIRHEQADSVPTEAVAQLSLKPQQTAEVQVNILSMADDKSDPEVQLSFVPDDEFMDITIWEGPNLRDRVRVETVSLGARVADVRLSPDGKYMLSFFSEMYDSQKTRRWAELSETATGKTVSSELPESAGWMPKGSTLYFTEQTDTTYDLYTLDPKTMRRTLKARNLPEANFAWAPDGKYIIYYDKVEGKAEEGIMRRVDNPDDRQPGNRDRVYLVKYDLEAGVAMPLTYGGVSTTMTDISPDSKKIIYVASKFVPERYPFYLSDLVQMDVNTLRTDTLAHELTTINEAVYSPDGRKLFLVGGPSMFDNLGKNCGDHPIANDFDLQGYIFDIETRKAKSMTLDFDPSIKQSPVWNKADGKIYFIGEKGFYNRMFCLNPSDGKIKELPFKDLESIRNFSIGDEEARWLAATGMSYTYAGRSALLDLKSGKSDIVDDPIAAMTGNIDFGRSEHWTFTAKDGTEIDGMITLPPLFNPDKKYPLVVYYYGGTSPSQVGMNHPYTPEMFASRDYVVYTINPSGTTGYGQEFSARHVNAWGDYTADDIIEGVKKFCDEHQFVDRKKIGCLGASYGGFMTQLLQTKTDIFAAAVSHAGISDVTSYWGEGFWGYSYNAVAAAQSYPWSNPDLFTKHGSLFNADKIHTPLLLLHGTVDTNVPIGESIQIYNALKILGRDVEFITVEGANHVVTEYEKRKVWQATIMAWFAKYLQDDPRWWNEMYSR